MATLPAPVYPDVPTTPAEEQTILHQADVERVIDARVAALITAGKLTA